VVGVGICEEQAELALVQFPLKRHLLGQHLTRQLFVLASQLLQLEEIPSLPLQALPGLQLVPVLGSFPRHATGGGRVVPDTGLRELLL